MDLQNFYKEQQSCYRNATDYSVGIYCRLSVDDGQTGDSSSIQTQKMMLNKWCADQGFKVYDIYVDDGYSGSNFNRPDFNRLIEDVESDRVNMIITKDLSRLGRDYIQTGYYTEIYFPEKAVRYVAINDGVDTLKADNDIAPFKNILNDMYAKDISRKIKASLRHRALQGMFTGSGAPYGYKKHPDNKNKLIIEQETAEVVKQIFSLILSGYSATHIAKQLSQEKVLTPAAMKARLGDTRFQRYLEESDCKWNPGLVHSLLDNPVYTGAMVSSKTYVANHKTKKHIVNKSDKWIVIPNMHEAIITKEDFDRVQELKKDRHCSRTKHKMDNLFRGLVKCSVCGSSMVLTTQLRYGKLVSYYRCSTFTKVSCKEEKHWTTIKYDEIKETVAERLKEYFASFKNDDRLKDMIRQKIKDSSLIVNYEKELAQIGKRKATLTNITKKVYEDFFAGLINEETYLELIKKYQTEQSELKEKQEILLVAQNKKDDCLEDHIKSFLDVTVLKRETIFNLIDKIEIRNIGGFKAHKQRIVNITYRFLESDITPHVK